MQFQSDEEKTSGLLNTPEKALILAVLRRAIMDACSPMTIDKSDRKSALEYIFGESEGDWWPYSLKRIAAYLSDEPEDFISSVRAYVEKARAEYQVDDNYRKKKRRRRQWSPSPLTGGVSGQNLL